MNLSTTTAASQVGDQRMSHCTTQLMHHPLKLKSWRPLQKHRQLMHHPLKHHQLLHHQLGNWIGLTQHGAKAVIWVSTA